MKAISQSTTMTCKKHPEERLLYKQRKINFIPMDFHSVFWGKREQCWRTFSGSHGVRSIFKRTAEKFDLGSMFFWWERRRQLFYTFKRWLSFGIIFLRSLNVGFVLTVLASQFKMAIFRFVWMNVWKNFGRELNVWLLWFAFEVSSFFKK